jgi:hypothetical protein
MLALTGTARRWEPKRIRLRLLSVAGRLARGWAPALCQYSFADADLAFRAC